VRLSSSLLLKSQIRGNSRQIRVTYQVINGPWRPCKVSQFLFEDLRENEMQDGPYL
jgi:hypothetical protein